MNIRAVHTALAGVLDDLTISQPFSQAVVKVWPYTPAMGVTIQEFSFILSHDLTAVNFYPNGFTEQTYDMHVQFFGMNSSGQAHVAAEAANSFLDALITALSAHVKLGGTDIQLINGLRGAGGGGTLVTLEWAGIGYVGLDLVLPITLHDERTRGV